MKVDNDPIKEKNRILMNNQLIKKKKRKERHNRKGKQKTGTKMVNLNAIISKIILT